jgi:hypothetical protein
MLSTDLGEVVLPFLFYQDAEIAQLAEVVETQAPAKLGLKLDMNLLAESLIYLAIVLESRNDNMETMNVYQERNPRSFRVYSIRCLGFGRRRSLQGDIHRLNHDAICSHGSSEPSFTEHLLRETVQSAARQANGQQSNSLHLGDGSEALNSVQLISLQHFGLFLNYCRVDRTQVHPSTDRPERSEAGEQQ